MKTELKPKTLSKSESNEAHDAAATESDLLLKHLAEQRDLHLRLAADFENYKRRSRQEAETRAAAQKDAFIVELLPVVDNLERALVCGAARNSEQFYQGVDMTLKQLQQLLHQHGIESDEIVGQPFDPHRQEALAQGYDPAQPEHSVLMVLQRGYRQGEKVVRPARVTINDLTASKRGRDGR